ncbi:MAG: hypothetical protein K0S99_2273 [Thermomicrobiales bacterium]|nr:hypothetical protein [Thermomicrobiales bacterium]
MDRSRVIPPSGAQAQIDRDRAAIEAAEEQRDKEVTGASPNAIKKSASVPRRSRRRKLRTRALRLSEPLSVKPCASNASKRPRPNSSGG